MHIEMQLIYFYRTITCIASFSCQISNVEAKAENRKCVIVIIATTHHLFNTSYTLISHRINVRFFCNRLAFS